jgi:hypothetical protein
MASKDRGSYTPYQDTSGAIYKQISTLGDTNNLPLDEVAKAWCPGDARSFSSDVAPESAQVQCNYKGSFPDTFHYSDPNAGKG